MNRIAIAAIFLVGIAAAAASDGRRDPLFAQVPFDQWRADGKRSLLHSAFDIVPPELSAFQRIVAGVRVQIDVSELSEHHALLFVEFEDSEGKRWQTHGSVSPQTEYLQNAFVLPGDYTVAVAMFDPVTQKHGFAQKKLHVPTLRNEPLPGSWEGLPSVEFLPPDADLSDSWFLPSISTGLKLRVETRSPVHVEVLVNVTASDRTSDSVGELRRNMSAVIPVVKVISQVDLRNGTLGISFLDIIRRRESTVSSWGDIKGFLALANPGIIDVHALDSRFRMRGFFADEVVKHVAGEPPRVVIVLSGPAFLGDQDPPAKLELPTDASHRVFYVRCRLIPHSVLMPRPRPRPGARPQPARFSVFRLALDDLEQPLEASGAMIFDVITPEQFRRVLASIIGQIARL